MKIKDVLEEYFVFSKRERLGIYILSFITLMVWAIPFFFATTDSIEDIFTVTYIQMDSAREQLIAKQQTTKTDKSANSARGIDFKNTRVVGTSKRNTIAILNVNDADSIEFEKLPLIGEKLSSRIVRYRERLGGFIKLSQLKEVYGITDSTYERIVPYLMISKDFNPRQININTATYDDLRKHPYAHYRFIKIVLAYRNTHGQFLDKQALEKVEQIDHLVIDKIAPYLSYRN